MTTPQKQEEVALFHQEFLKSPVAQQLRRILQKHEDNIVQHIITHAMDVEGTTDQQIRQYAVQLATAKAISNLIYDNSTFVSKSIS